MPQQPWFGRKRYGWGLTPISWQGWALTAAYIAIAVVLGFTLAGRQTILFWTLLAIATVVYGLIAFLTREG